MVRILKMDRESATGTYDVFLKTLSTDGIPTKGWNGQSRQVDSGAGPVR
jgi:hypothetical protein